jgi:hypothetical protein
MNNFKQQQFRPQGTMFLASGLPASDWCLEHDISAPSIVNYRKLRASKSTS